MESSPSLLDNVENAVWHAFDHLALEGDGTAPKSKLKVREKTHAAKVAFLFSRKREAPQRRPR